MVRTRGSHAIPGRFAPDFGWVDGRAVPCPAFLRYPCIDILLYSTLTIQYVAVAPRVRGAG